MECVQTRPQCRWIANLAGSRCGIPLGSVTMPLLATQGRNGHRTQRVDIGGSIKTFCAHSENHSFVRAVSSRFERHRTCATKRRQLTSSAANGASSRNCPQILNQVASNHVENQEFQTARPRGAENDDLLCVVCLTEPKNHACVPCGHVCVCARCGGNVEFAGRKQCLMFRSTRSQIIQIFT